MLIAYLAGSIPVGRLVASRVGGPDPRTVGSQGSVGRTRSGRSDANGRRSSSSGISSRGHSPSCWHAGAGPGQYPGGGTLRWTAVAGAIWSVFAGFRSGRGVATGVGTMLVIQPVAVLLATPVFVIAILVTRSVSVGSLLASAALFPAMLLVLLVVPRDAAPIRDLQRGRGGLHLARPRRQHRPTPPRHRAQVRPKSARREAPQSVGFRAWERRPSADAPTERDHVPAIPVGAFKSALPTP